MAALAGGDSPPLPPPEPSKGKAKMDGEAEVEGAGKMCGICYVDGGRAIRGEIDCCAHYFCFVCIMAWGRVESRCPLCKARFRTIRRPPVPGRFPDERIVSVPERNQALKHSRKLLGQQHIPSWLPADLSTRHRNPLHSQDRFANTAPKSNR
jgi:hypothetical protein